MKRSKLASLTGITQLLVVCCLLMLSEKTVQAEMGVSFVKFARLARAFALDFTAITPSNIFSNAKYQTGGVALRNRKLGTISISGIPAGSTVKEAYLYWMWASLATPVPTVHDRVSFQRIEPTPPAYQPLRTGTLVGTGPDPCWLGDSNFVYRADVTGLVKTGGIYEIGLHPLSSAQYDRADPFAVPPVAPLAEGASLVVVYSNSVESMGTVRIYDVGLAGTMFNDALTYDLTDLPVGGTLSSWDTIGGDGQTGFGRLASVGGKTTTIDGVAVAGPGSVYNDSDWNGSDGKPLPQLWDTHGHEVDLPIGASGSVTVGYTSPGDCLVPVANITLSFP